MQIPASLPLFRSPVDLKLLSRKVIAVVWVRSHCLLQEMILASSLPSLPRNSTAHTPPTAVPERIVNAVTGRRRSVTTATALHAACLDKILNSISTPGKKESL